MKMSLAERVPGSRLAGMLAAVQLVGLGIVTGVGQEPAPAPAATPTPATPPPKSGSLFDRLKKVLPDDTKALRDKLDSTIKSGTDSLQGLMNSISIPREQMDAMLSYLDQKLAGRTSTITDAQVEAYARTLIPIVEELNQRKFTTPPQVKTVGTLQLVHALAQDLVPQFEKKFPGVSKPLIYLRAYLSAGMVSPSLLGKYSAANRIVYVVPMNLEATLKEKEMTNEHREQILQIVIGHELIHNLQDQEVDLKRLILSAESDDASQAVNAVIEGHAVFMQNAIAGRLKFQEAARKASELFLADDDLKEDAWVYERIAHVQNVLGEQTYLGGSRFVAYYHARGGVPAIWNLLAHPPQRSSMITQPETYTATPPPTPDYNTKFAPLRASSGLDDNWTLNAAAIGDFELRGILSSSDRATRERLLRGLTEAVAVHIPHKTELTRDIDVALFTFKTEQDAAAMAETAEKMVLQDFKDMERNPRIRTRDNTKQPYSIGPGSTGTAWRYSVEAFLLGKNDYNTIVVRQKNIVVNLSESASGLTPPQLAKLVSECVEKMKP